MRTVGKKRIGQILSVLLALFCCFFLPVQAFAQENVTADGAGVKLSLSYGYRNTAKTGQLLPVAVTVENCTGDRISGFLSVDIPGEDGSISYTSSVKIPEGTSVIKRTVTIPDGVTGGDGDRLRARLFDDSGEEIASAQIMVTYLGSGREVLCGILSDDQEDLLYLGNISLGDNLSTRVVTLNPADLPEDADGLNQLDIIVISSFDLSRISDNTASAVMSWVENGGTLIMGTGAKQSPLGVFRTLIGSPELGLAAIRDVDMGMQYSTSGPDGAVFRMQLRMIGWDGAVTIQSSGERDLVLRKPFGKGSVSLASYDLCALKSFASGHPEFTQDFLMAAVGQTGLSRISGSLLSAEERLAASRELTNTYDASRIPGIVFYVIAAVLFLLLTGTVLYRILAGKGLGIYYMLGVLILSAAFALFFWMAGAGTRITGPFIRYGTVAEFSLQEEETTRMSIKGYLNLESASESAITLELPEDCMVRPVITNGAVSVTSGKKKMLAVAGQKQFETNIFQVEQNTEGTVADVPFTVEMITGENGLSGTITNNSRLEYSGLALLSRNEIIVLGTMKPGESRNFSSAASVKGPMLLNSLVSSYLADMEKGVALSLQRNSLRSYYLRESVSLSEGKMLLLGFAENYRPSFLERTEYDTEGSNLFVLELSAAGNDPDGDFLKALETEPKVVSGSYDTATGCLKGSGATILEFSLGSGYTLTGVTLQGLSPELEGRGVTAFSGQIAMYNYATGSFDLVDAGKTGWTAAELKTYLSPANNLMLRFLPDGEHKAVLPVYVPKLYIQGSVSTQQPEAAVSHVEISQEASPKQTGTQDMDYGPVTGPVPETEANSARIPGDY